MRDPFCVAKLVCICIYICSEDTNAVPEWIKSLRTLAKESLITWLVCVRYKQMYLEMLRSPAPHSTALGLFFFKTS